jgi:hypothetical protein
MQLFLTAFESVPDPRAENTRHALAEVLIIAFSTVFRMLDPKALDTAFGQLTSTLVSALTKGGVIAIDGAARPSRHRRQAPPAAGASRRTP